MAGAGELVHEPELDDDLARLQRHPGAAGDLARDRPRRDRQGGVLRLTPSPTYGPIAPNYKWYNQAVEKYNQFDPNLSKKLLDQAGWVVGSGGVREKAGKKLAFTHLDWAAQPQGRLIMEAIVPMMQDIGITMAVKSLESAAFFPAYPKSQSFGYEWLWSSPMDVLVIFNVIPNAAYNGALPDLTAAFKLWQSSANDAQLKAAALKAQLIWAQKLPKIPIVTRNDIWVNNKKVHGWRPDTDDALPSVQRRVAREVDVARRSRPAAALERVTAGLAL